MLNPRPTSLRHLSTAAFFLAGAATVPAAELVRAAPLTAEIVMLHFDEGHVEYHRRGEPRTADRVHIAPLDVAAASDAARYAIVSTDDPNYAEPRAPLDVGRKSKGTEFAWFVDQWIDGRAVNTRPDHVKEHWLYLRLPAPLRPGATYTVRAPELSATAAEWSFVFDVDRVRSEAVHVNTLGHVPAAPRKFAYVYHWMGDRGSLDLGRDTPREFRIRDLDTDEIVYRGPVRFRAPRDRQETYHRSDSPPHGNFLGADVWECDFSAFDRPGRYVVAVDGVGCSWPFRLDDDVYREAFVPVARALYHNRSGIELEARHTEFVRPAPHHPAQTPGFAGRLFYTDVRFTEWGSEGGDPVKLRAGARGPLDAWGWYQDAGDWDGYYSHLRVAQELLLAYELAPANFRDGELNIPESGNGVPDILDEAAWLPRFCHRLRHELIAKGYGTGGVGLRVAGDAFGPDEKVLPDGRRVGQGSWEDVDRDWAVSGEDPWSTYRYAGAAAQLAYALRLAGVEDPEGVDWRREALEAWAWARDNTRPGDDQPGQGRPPLRDPRAYAAAALFRLTGDRAYERQFASDLGDVQAHSSLDDERRYAAWLYVLGPMPVERDRALHERIRSSVLRTASDNALVTGERRALRWGGIFSFPMLIGQQTTPWLMEAAVAHALLRDTEPARAREFLAALYTTADYFLGTNALNMTWMTGVGPRYPKHIFHMDAWYNTHGGRYHPGLIPYSPWRKETDRPEGPWHQDWPNQTVHPPIDEWPGNERWFSNRCSPMGSEFTVHQNLGPAAAYYGLLCAPGPTAARPKP